MMKSHSNYRLTNITAAIGVAQMEYIEQLLKNKRETARLYSEFFNGSKIKFILEQHNSQSNYWLNTVQLKNRRERDEFLDFTNSNGIMTRPVWRLMNKLEMYKNCQTDDLENSQRLEDTAVNIPSGFRNNSISSEVMFSHPIINRSTSQ